MLSEFSVTPKNRFQARAIRRSRVRMSATLSNIEPQSKPDVRQTAQFCVNMRTLHTRRSYRKAPLDNLWFPFDWSQFCAMLFVLQILRLCTTILLKPASSCVMVRKSVIHCSTIHAIHSALQCVRLLINASMCVRM